MSADSDQTMDRIGPAMGRIPSGCAIMTARSANGRTGMLASWYQQAAFEPPMVTVSVKKGRPIEALIEQSGAFVLNLLGEKSADMFKHFGRGFAPEEDAFAGLNVRDIDEGVVIEGLLAWLACRVRWGHEAGDHWLYAAEITDAAGEGEQPPHVHIRKNGMGY